MRLKEWIETWKALMQQQPKERQQEKAEWAFPTQTAPAVPQLQEEK